LRQLNDDEEELLSRVAWYYYHDGLTQHDVGQRLGLSRIKVSRLLERGKRSGIIGFTIHSEYSGCLKLEAQLRDRYGLKEALVVPQLDEDDGPTITRINERLAQASAGYLMHFLSEGSLLAIGWGDTVTRVLSRLGFLLGDVGASLVTLSGGVSTYIQVVGGLSAALTHARRLHMIPTPLLVSSSVTATALRSEPEVGDVLQIARTANYALVGIGAVDENASLVRGGYASKAEMLRYSRQGAVGDILGQFFDHGGTVLPLAIHDRIIGIDLETLRELPCVIGVAGGPQKTAAIKAALRGGYLDVIITDYATATAVLETGA